MAGKEENKKLEEYENENYYLLWWALHYSTRYTHMVTHPNTNPNKEDLTLLSGRNMLLSLWYSDSMLTAFFKISKMRKVIKKRKNIWYCMAGKVEDKKLEE